MKLTPGVAIVDTNGLLDAQIPAAAVKLLEPDLLDRLDERRLLPSMIGISGPSSSTTDCRRPARRRAAIRCSTVETPSPAGSPSTVQRAVEETLFH
jgi:hypothetical protein